MTTTEDIELYAQNLYHAYKESRKDKKGINMLFGVLPNSYSSECAPLPWTGNILSAEIAIISLEPLLVKDKNPDKTKKSTFEKQCEISNKSYCDWHKLYLEKFEEKPPNERLQPYWSFLSAFLTEYSSMKDGTPRQIRDNASFVEIPFCPYHAEKHTSFIPDEKLVTDFRKRLSLFLNNSVANKKVLCLGRPQMNFFINHFDIDISNFKNVIADNPEYFGTRRRIPVFAGQIVIDGKHVDLILRPAPFANGFQPSHTALRELGKIVKAYQS